MCQNGAFLPTEEIGEVVAKGDGLMNGYDNLPDDKQPVDSNGWLHTGDLGYFDQDGYLHLSGRIKDVIIRGGENISPLEIENALYKLDYIREAKVMGAPHPIYGESVEACVTMKDESTDFNPADIKKELLPAIVRFKLPSHIFLYKSFPLNVNGKLDQKQLRADMLNERITNAYSGTGDIRVKITLMPEWLRISFSDNGAEYYIDKRRDTSASAKIILAAVSDFHTEYMNGKPVYCLLHNTKIPGETSYPNPVSVF